VPQGKVKWFSAEKAFGFIEQDPDNDIFVHVTGLAHGVTTLEKDQLVEYETEQGRKGPQATNVRPVAAAPAAEEAAPEAEEAEDEDVEVDVEVIEVEEDVVVVEIEEETASDAE
jgi:CspA family cold shock protein